MNDEVQRVENLLGQANTALDGLDSKSAATIGGLVEFRNIISAPPLLTWHLILEAELTQLSQPETWAFGSIGFTALGVALGAVPQAAEVLAKLLAGKPTAFTTGELASLFIMVAGAVAAIVCLMTFGINRYRNRGLAARIRDRGGSGAPPPR
jgi:hypothetical protein